MIKKLLIIFICISASFFSLIKIWNLYAEIDNSLISLDFVIPIFCKKQVITLQNKNFFDEERLEKLYLSNWQANRVLNKIKNDDNWSAGKIDKELIDLMKSSSRENIFNQIPYIENKYWIFTNFSNEAKNRHSTKEILHKMYYSVSFAVYDIDNKVLYYYDFSR